MADYIDFSGHRGPYRYWFVTGTVKSEAGNYMFVKPTNSGWVPVYVGIADDLNNRLCNHDMLKTAGRCGATRVVAHTQPDARAPDRLKKLI